MGGYKRAIIIVDIALGNKHDVLREKNPDDTKISNKVLNFKTEATERREANEKQRYVEKTNGTDPGNSSHGHEPGEHFRLM